MSTPPKDKGRVPAALNKTDSATTESYQLSCYLCLKPSEENSFGTGVFIARQRHKNGREIMIRYDLCQHCMDEMRQSQDAIDVWNLRTRVQLEPLAKLIADGGDAR